MCSPGYDVGGDELLIAGTSDADCLSGPQDGIIDEVNVSSIESTTMLFDPGTATLPIDMTFNDGHIVSIVTYSVLLVISVCGNITVLVSLVRRRHISNPRVNIMLIHLAIADLLVSELLCRKSRESYARLWYQFQVGCALFKAETSALHARTVESRISLSKRNSHERQAGRSSGGYFDSRPPRRPFAFGAIFRWLAPSKFQCEALQVALYCRTSKMKVEYVKDRSVFDSAFNRV